MERGFFVLNEKFYLDTERAISHYNRAFCYGDALFETIRCLGTQPCFMDLHSDRLIKGMKVLKMNAPNNFRQTLSSTIEKLLNKNRIFKGSRIRITVFRDDGGLYTPETNNISWLMEASSLENEKFILEPKGLTIDIYDDIHKPVNLLSNLKTTNALIYILAGIYRKENRIDECLILNQFGRITESISSNIFIVHGKTIITPTLSEGCIEGTMRRTIIDLARENGYEIVEKGVLEKYLVDAEEVFLTNAIQGIKWVSAYKDRRYFNFVSRKLIAILNQQF
jgi:branched-subunit amino acid aminotransferase/4-amino-4-deoxychorismate lyase